MLVVNSLPANAGDVRGTGYIPGSGRSPGGGHGNPLQYSCLKNPMNWGAWQAAVHRVAQSRTRLKWFHMHALYREDIYLQGIKWWILRMCNIVTFWDSHVASTGKVHFPGVTFASLVREGASLAVDREMRGKWLATPPFSISVYVPESDFEMDQW